MMRGMELRQLRYFVAVADELHFTRAAARLEIAQPPLSQQVRRLEHDLGVRLFDRTNRRVQLTDVGRAFLMEAKLTLAQADRAIDAARRARTSSGGRIVIGAQGSAEVIVFPRVLPRFLKRRPAVDVTVQSPLTPAEQVAMLRNGQIDVGFLRLPVQDPALVVVPILSEPLVAALPMRHLLARRRSVTLQELAASTFVMFRRQNAPGMYGIIMGIWRAAGLKPKVLEDTMRMQTILSLIAVGRGVSLVPTSAMGLGRRGVVFRPVRPSLPKVGMGVAYNPANRSPLVSALLDIVEAVFRVQLPRSLPRPARADRKRDGKALRSN
jgi:LysR family transcriptional regulator, benzoate and cis,cis-muconate-responsive activator of ben and cat genes